MTQDTDDQAAMAQWAQENGEGDAGAPDWGDGGAEGRLGAAELAINLKLPRDGAQVV
jgi:hypothetical protein